MQTRSYQVLFFENYPVLLKRKPYTSMKLQVTSNGSLICYVNQKTKPSDVSVFLSTQKKWIFQQLHKIEKLAQDYPPIYWNPHTQIPFLGKFKLLKIFWGKPKHITVYHNFIEIHLPHQKLTQKEWTMCFADHYKKIGTSLLKNRLEKWSDKMSLFPKKVEFKNPKTQWGSCSTSGHVSLNWKLIVAPLPVIDYVIVHELSHLKHPNHSSCFWKFVQSYSQRSQECRAWLRRNQFAFDFLEDVPQLHASFLHSK